MFSKPLIVKTFLLIGGLLVFLLPAISQIKDPQVINASGGSFSKDDILIDWSFAELLSVKSFSPSGDFMLTTGFLQSLFIAPLPIGSAEIYIGPNPTAALITVRTSIPDPGKITIKVMRSDGYILQQFEEKYTGLVYNRQLNLSTYSSGIYFIHVQYTAPDQQTKQITRTIVKF